MPENTGDIQLLVRISQGDHLAFRRFFDAHYPQVLGFLKSFLHTDADASDVAQDVFIKIWKMRAILPEIRSVSGYMYHMSVNTAINWARRHRRYSDVFALDIPEDQMVEELIDMKEKESRLAAAVLGMPEQRRRIFIMSRFELIPNSRIAETLGISKKTVENHLNLALRELRLSGIL